MVLMGKLRQKEVIIMISFFFGFVIGSLCGVFSLALLVGGKCDGKK